MRPVPFLLLLGLTASAAFAQEVLSPEAKREQFLQQAAERRRQHKASTPRPNPQRTVATQIKQEYDMQELQKLQRQQVKSGRSLPAEQKSKLQKAEYDRLESKVQREDKERIAKSKELAQEKERDTLEARRQQMQKLEEAKREQEKNQAYQKKLQGLSNEMNRAKEQSSKGGPDAQKAEQRYEQLSKEYNKTLTEWQAKNKAIVDYFGEVQKENIPPPVPDSPEVQNSGFDR